MFLFAFCLSAATKTLSKETRIVFYDIDIFGTWNCIFHVIIYNYLIYKKKTLEKNKNVIRQGQ